jgi:hypothetical protein
MRDYVGIFQEQQGLAVHSEGCQKAEGRRGYVAGKTVRLSEWSSREKVFVKKFKMGVDSPFVVVLIYTSRRETASSLKTEQREQEIAWALVK